LKQEFISDVAISSFLFQNTLDLRVLWFMGVFNFLFLNLSLFNRISYTSSNIMESDNNLSACFWTSHTERAWRTITEHRIIICSVMLFEHYSFSGTRFSIINARFQIASISDQSKWFTSMLDVSGSKLLVSDICILEVLCCSHQ
jgi:hypothetical protein